MRSSRLASGLLILLIGVMFLLANAGYMELGVWRVVARLWPVLLIIAGVTLLLGKGLRWFLVALLVVVIGAGTFGGPLVSGWATGPLTSVAFGPQQQYTELAGLRVDLALDVPNIRLLAPATGDFRLELAYRGTEAPTYSHTHDGGVGRISLTQRARAQVNVLGGYGVRQNLTMALPGGVPLDLYVTSGVLSADLDLSLHQLRYLDIDAGVSNLKLRLGVPDGSSQVVIDSGVTNLEIAVPHGVGIRAIAEVGVGARGLSGAGLRQVGTAWEDDLYATATSRLDIRLTAGVGRIELVRY